MTFVAELTVHNYHVYHLILKFGNIQVLVINTNGISFPSNGMERMESSHATLLYNIRGAVSCGMSFITIHKPSVSDDNYIINHMSLYQYSSFLT